MRVGDIFKVEIITDDPNIATRVWIEDIKKILLADPRIKEVDVELDTHNHKFKLLHKKQLEEDSQK